MSERKVVAVSAVYLLAVAGGLAIARLNPGAEAAQHNQIATDATPPGVAIYRPRWDNRRVQRGDCPSLAR